MAHKDPSQLAGAPDHPVLAEPWTYTIIGLNVSFDHADARRNTLDLLLTRNGSRILLRFTGVSEIEVDAGFPYSYMGLEILDVSHLQWDMINIRVEGFEPSPGIRFWASSVTKVCAETSDDVSAP